MTHTREQVYNVWQQHQQNRYLNRYNRSFHCMNLSYNKFSDSVDSNGRLVHTSRVVWIGFSIVSSNSCIYMTWQGTFSYVPILSCNERTPCMKLGTTTCFGTHPTPITTRFSFEKWDENGLSWWSFVFHLWNMCGYLIWSHGTYQREIWASLSSWKHGHDWKTSLSWLAAQPTI